MTGLMRFASIGSIALPVATWSRSRAEMDPVAYLDIGSIDRERKEICAVAHVAPLEAPSRAKYIVRGEDILVSTVRPSLNAVAVVPLAMTGAVASSGFSVIRTDERKAVSRFVFHWVRTKWFIDELVRQATGASYPAVSNAIVEAAQLPLPALDDQRRIAAILDKADAICRKRQEAIALTEQLLRSTFLEMFGDPVTNLKGWPLEQLQRVAKIGSGVMKGRDYTGVATVERPYMRVANVQDGYLALDDIKNIEMPAAEADRYMLRYGDILLTEGGDPDKLGRGAIWRDQISSCVHQNHIFSVRPDGERVTPEFLSALFGSAHGKRYFLRAAKQTTGIASINRTQLSEFPVLVPPLKLQRDYTDFVGVCERARSRYQLSLKEHANLFNSLVHRAFTGQL